MSVLHLDRTDRRILEVLQKNGAISNLELADQIGLSPSPCSRRVKALQDAGIIAKTVAVLDPEHLGLDLVAMVSVSLDRHTPDRFKKFDKLMSSLEQVQFCYLMTGHSADYMLKVVVADMNAYQKFLLEELLPIEGVSGVHSSFVMRKVVDSTHLPVGA